MRLTSRTTAYVLTAAAVVAISGGLATTAFAGTTDGPSNIPVPGPLREDPIKAVDFPADYHGEDLGPEQILRLPDGSTVVRPGASAVMAGADTIKRLPNGALLVAAGVPVAVRDGAVFIGDVARLADVTVTPTGPAS